MADKSALILSGDNADVTSFVRSFLTAQGYSVVAEDPLVVDSRGWKIKDYSLIVIEGPDFFFRLVGMVHVVRSLNREAEVIVLTDKTWSESLRVLLRQDRVWVSDSKEGLSQEKIRDALSRPAKGFTTKRPFEVYIG
jgi:hypothetical protein